LGDIPDPVEVGHRSAAKFHYDPSHLKKCSLRRKSKKD